MRNKLLLLGTAHMVQVLAEKLASEKILDEIKPPQDVYQLTFTHAPEERMVVIPKKERSYSTNTRHSKVPRKK